MPQNMATLILYVMAAAIGVAVPLASEKCLPFRQANPGHPSGIGNVLITWLQMLSARSCAISSIGL